MSEENNDQQAEQGKPAEFTPITSQEEFDKALSKRLERERSKFADYDALREKASKFDEVQEQSKTEAQKAAERAEAAEERAKKAENEALRFRIANEYKLSQEDAMALEHVATEDGMRTVADRLRAREEGTRPKPPTPKSLKSGSTASEPTGEKGRAAAALRTLRQG